MQLIYKKHPIGENNAPIGCFYRRTLVIIVVSCYENGKIQIETSGSALHCDSDTAGNTAEQQSKVSRAEYTWVVQVL